MPPRRVPRTSPRAPLETDEQGDKERAAAATDTAETPDATPESTAETRAAEDDTDEEAAGALAPDETPTEEAAVPPSLGEPEFFEPVMAPRPVPATEPAGAADRRDARPAPFRQGGAARSGVRAARTG